jgi:hypothetical protein
MQRFIIACSLLIVLAAPIIHSTVSADNAGEQPARVKAGLVVQHNSNRGPARGDFEAGGSSIIEAYLFDTVRTPIYQGTMDTIEVVFTGETEEVSIWVAGISELTGPANWLSVVSDSIVIPRADPWLTYGSIDVISDARSAPIPKPVTRDTLTGEIYLATTYDPPNDTIVLYVSRSLFPPTSGLVYDTVSTGTVQLLAGSHGEMGGTGNLGEGGLNLDYVDLGGDCDSTANVYLYSGSPFVIIDHGDSSYSFSHSTYELSDAGMLAFKPIAEGGGPQHLSGSNWDGFTTGTMLDNTQKIAMVKTFYAPTGGFDSANFIIEVLKVWAYDTTRAHRIAVGEILDWDVPSDRQSDNQTGIVSDMVYFQGVDTSIAKCQDNQGRYAASAFLAWGENVDTAQGDCNLDDRFYGMYVVPANEVPDGLEEAESFLYNTGAHTGLTTLEGESDFAEVVTYLHRYDIHPGDTLTFYSALVTIRDGNSTDLYASSEAASAWFQTVLVPNCSPLTCCVGITGNVDCDTEEHIDIGDLTRLLQCVYLNPGPDCFCCPEEANMDGDASGLIDIGDLTALIAYLYIPPNPLPAPCP